MYQSGCVAPQFDVSQPALVRSKWGIAATPLHSGAPGLDRHAPLCFVTAVIGHVFVALDKGQGVQLTVRSNIAGSVSGSSLACRS